MAAAGPRFDLPGVDDTTRPFWDGAREGRLRVMRCRACQTVYFYPRPFCPACWNEDVEWIDASGRATLYTYSVVHQNDLPPFPSKVPYVAAIVDLDEGPRMMTHIVDCPHDRLRIGMALEVVFQPETEEITLPVFRPAAT